MVIFLLPLAINSAHELLNHEHSVCSSKVVQHLHEKDFDCNLNLLKQSTPHLALNSYGLQTQAIVKTNNSTPYNFLKNYQQLSFSLRGPPLHILA
ncbi:hypothetical protein [Polaribacter sp. MED152]|uniref:hypothetical protein n=1 Tax=Polaribacter sp. MED152 TaxID=313598 RepID=UPI000068C6E0|nr:hypothetical protein [Polaribacter sp. MED152]EAQ41290.1 hypothetical protein MED152_01210 [Polaribacter sp. MED152]